MAPSAKSYPRSHTTPIAAPASSLSAGRPLISTIDVVRPAIVQRGSRPTAVTSRFSDDCAAAGVKRHASDAMMSRLGDLHGTAVIVGAPEGDRVAVRDEQLRGCRQRRRETRRCCVCATALTTTPRASLLPHRIPIAPQLARQHPLHALRLRVGQGIEPGVQVGSQPHAIPPHVLIVLDAVLVALEPRLRVEPRHPHIERRLAGVMTRIGGAELGMVPPRGTALDHADAVSRHPLPYATPTRAPQGGLHPT